MNPVEARQKHWELKATVAARNAGPSQLLTAADLAAVTGGDLSAASIADHLGLRAHQPFTKHRASALLSQKGLPTK